ncbi:hypothetical protein PALU110988_21250 [Paenibacillus lupini]|nr:hypothetical protein [Paenibacillus lupini]
MPISTLVMELHYLMSHIALRAFSTMLNNQNMRQASLKSEATSLQPMDA